MSSEAMQNSSHLFQIVEHGGFTLYVLLVCSLVVWAVIMERLWKFRKLDHDLHAFHLQALNLLIRRDTEALRRYCHEQSRLPTSRLVMTALERIGSNDERLRARWLEALERKRQIVNQDLRQNLWILGTIGSAAPFIGLFGTVLGILQSFQNIAKTGNGGFAIVATGISEALVATAAGIIVAVIAVMAYNAFQTRWSGLVLTIKLQTEELAEMLEPGGARGD